MDALEEGEGTVVGSVAAVGAGEFLLEKELDFEALVQVEPKEEGEGED